MKIERPQTGYQTLSVSEGGKLKTYHNIGGMWGKKIWHEGEWAIYEPFHEYETNALGINNSVLVHSRIWTERKVVHKTPEPTRQNFRMDEAAIVPNKYWETEEIEMVCHTKIYPTHGTHCHTCQAKIPEGAIALWKLLNAEALLEEV